jgi:hypothetical protein
MRCSRDNNVVHTLGVVIKRAALQPQRRPALDMVPTSVRYVAPAARLMPASH